MWAGLPGRLNLKKALIVVAAQEDGPGIGRIRMRQIVVGDDPQERRQRAANAGLARAHKAGQRDDPRRGRLLAGLGISEHFGADGECGGAAND